MAMTVRELIEVLQGQDQDAVVQLYTYDDYQDEPVLWMELEEVEAATQDKTWEPAVPHGTPVVRLRY